MTQVNALFLHHRDNFRVHPITGGSSCGQGSRRGRVGQLVEEGGGHLRATSIVNTGEDDGFHGSSISTTDSRCGRTLRELVTRQVSSALVNSRLAWSSFAPDGTLRRARTSRTAI